MPNQPIDVCGLCQEKRTLSESYLIPAGLYRLCRAEGDNNPHPVVITHKSEGRSSSQMQDYFLCKECEDRFNKQGENWAMRYCYRGKGKFLLQDMLAKESPIQTADGASVFAGSEIQSLDIRALTYFPMSVFWRSAARPWNIRGGQIQPIALGTRYQEEIRLYLLGKHDFPKYAALMVWVSKKVSLLAAHFPFSERAGMVHRHRFYIPGVQFILSLGKQVDQSYMRACIVHGRKNPIWLSDEVELAIVKKFRIHMSRK